MTLDGVESREVNMHQKRTPLSNQHPACQEVKPERSFLRRMIKLSKVAKQLHHHIHLNAEFWSDLEWWVTFLPQWNGVRLLSNLCCQPHSREITSDASGSWGCGAYYSQRAPTNSGGMCCLGSQMARGSDPGTH